MKVKGDVRKWWKEFKYPETRRKLLS